MNHDSPFYKYPHRKSIMQKKQSKTALWFSLLLVLLLGLASIKFLSLAYQGQIALLTSDPAKPIREEIKKQVFLSLEQVAWLETLTPNNLGWSNFTPDFIFSRDGRYLALTGAIETKTNKKEDNKITNNTALLDTFSQKIVKFDNYLPISDWSGGVIILFDEGSKKVIAYDLIQDISRDLIIEEKVYKALISPDGEKVFINYVSDKDKFESVIVWLNSGQVMTTNFYEGVISSVWNPDGRGIFGFVHTDSDDLIVQKPAYFSLENNKWEILNLGINEIHAKKWELLNSNKSAILTAGYDDGAYLYYLDLENKTSKPLGEISGGSNYIKFNPDFKTYYLIQNDGITIKNILNDSQEKITFPPSEIDYLAEVHQDNKGNLIIIKIDLKNNNSNLKEVLSFNVTNNTFKTRRFEFEWNGGAKIKGDWLIIPSKNKIGFFLLPTS